MSFQGGWSIGAEIIFYIFFAIIWKFTYNLKKQTFILWLIFFVTILCSYIFRVLYIPNTVGMREYEYGYYSFFSQLPTFVLGILVFRYIYVQKQAFILYTLVLLSSSLLFVRANDMLSVFQIHVAISALFALGVILVEKYKTYIEKSFSALQKIGICSYSMYITNMICMYTLRDILQIRTHINNYFVIYVIFSISTFLVSIPMYILIEKRFIEFGKLLNR